MVLKKLFKEQEGAVLVLVALGMTVLLGAVALAVDIGHVYAVRHNMQNAMDAAALAGVVELPEDPDAAKQKARDFAEENGYTLTQDPIVDNGNSDITVQFSNEVNTFFAGILGSDLDTMNVESITKARIGVTSEVVGNDNLVPFGLEVIEDEAFEIGTEYILREGGGGGEFGFFGWLYYDEDHNNPNTAEDYLKYGYKERVYVGQDVRCKPGVLGNNGRLGTIYRTNLCQHDPLCTKDSYVANCPRVIIVPIVSSSFVISGHDYVTVLGFASMFISDWQGSPGNGTIRATLINADIPGPVGGAGGVPNYGTRSYRLIQ